MARRRLRSGFTTGACAAAAARGAASHLAGRPVDEVTLALPWNRPDAREVRFRLVGTAAGEGWAAAGVVKDAGDDPDVTDGIEIRAAVRWGEEPPGGQRVFHDQPLFRVRHDADGPVTVEIDGGEGVGRVTKPGLAAPVGAAAINPVPREMIDAAVRDGLAAAGFRGRAAVRVVISVPRGAEVARKTLNARLGILGGLSILGTTGIVIPMSTDAWRATIDAGLDVARACGAQRAVLAHGRSSETAAQRLFPDLPEEAFVLMGDHVGYALDAAAERGIDVVLAGQFAKFCKVAAGNFETHVKDSTLDRGVVAGLLADAGFPDDRARAARTANTARQVFTRLLEEGDRGVFAALARAVRARAIERTGGRVSVAAVLFGYDKTVLARAGQVPA